MNKKLIFVIFQKLLFFSVLIFLLLPVTRKWAESSTIYNFNLLYCIYLVFLSFIISFIINPFLIKLSHSIGLLDHPDEARKHHKKPVALSGGSSIYLAFIATMLFNFHFSLEVKAILIASSLIFFVGLADDRWGLSANFRLAIQLIASFIVILYGVRVTFVPDFLGGIVTETIITIIWLIGITNSMNFIDGMDGVASGSGVIYGIFFAIVAFFTKQYYLLFFSCALVGSCLGFLPFNFRKKKSADAFLGDSGSTFLGFLLACFAILGNWGESIIDIIVPIFILSVLIFDMTLTTIYRISKGQVKTFNQWIHYTGRDHLHHRLADLTGSKYWATWLFWAISVSFGIEALAILFANVSVSLLILAHSILTFVIIGILLVIKGPNANSNQSNGINIERT